MGKACLALLGRLALLDIAGLVDLPALMAWLGRFALCLGLSDWIGLAWLGCLGFCLAAWFDYAYWAGLAWLAWLVGLAYLDWGHLAG